MTEILTSRAVADRFGVTVSTVARWANAGRLEPLTRTPGLRGMFLFTQEAVDEFAAEYEQAAS